MDSVNNQPTVIGVRISNYEPNMDYTPISMWGYFGYGIVFILPFIGWMIALLFALGMTNNINLRNYARSQFCILILLFIRVRMFGYSVGYMQL